jgi:hypothetical protein
MRNIKRIVFFGLLLLALISPYNSYAETKLAWDPPVAGGAVDGYRVYWRTADGVYSDANSVGDIKVTECPFNSLGLLQEKTTYFFAVKAYNEAGESENSNEVSWTVPDNTAPAIVQGIDVL